MANDDKTPANADDTKAEGTQPEENAQATGTAPEGTTPPEPAQEQEKPAPTRGGRKSEKIGPKAYGKDDEWPLGGAAPHDVVRVYDPATSVLGDARKGPAKPGERSILVAVKGDIITRSVLTNLGR